MDKLKSKFGKWQIVVAKKNHHKPEIAASPDFNYIKYKDKDGLTSLGCVTHSTPMGYC